MNETKISKEKPGNKRKKLKELSADEFLSYGLDSDVSLDGDDSSESINVSDVDIKKKRTIESKASNSKHKSALLKLEEKDPEFFKFLKENDEELLEFDESDGEDGDDDDENNDDLLVTDDEAGTDEGKKRKAHETSQEEEDEPEEEETEGPFRESKFSYDGKVITFADLASLTKGLQKQSLFSLRKLMRMFHDAVLEASDDESKVKVKYRVETPNVFNNLVMLCLKHASKVLQHHLSSTEKKAGQKTRLPSTYKQWSKVKLTVKNYLLDLLQLLRQIAEPAMLSVVLRHVQDLILYYACFTKITKMLVKRLVRMWSSAEEHVRVIAFLCLRKVAAAIPVLFEFLLKQMYIAFVKHTKFINFKTKPLVVFMQNCLIEIFAMDRDLTYQYGFVYIRQMAIHLRNAIAMKKKDSYQSVYNWQFISCLQLWGRVLGELHDETLAPLIYPLVQITLGAVRLIPTARYYPLRFHCLHSLNMLSKFTGTYIPVASYLIEILESSEFSRKSKPSTAKPPDLSCTLKLPKAQLHTRVFQDCILDNVMNLLLEHFVIHSTTIAFPELIFPICLRMKRFMKKTDVPKFSKQIKQIVDKLQEAGHEVSRKRSSVNFSPKDLEEVKNWENSYAQQKNSLQKFYETWLKMRDLAKSNEQSQAVEDDDQNDSSDEDEPKAKRKKRTEISKKSSDDSRKKIQNKSIAKDKPTPFRTFEDVIEKGHLHEDIVEDFVLSTDDED